MTTSLETAAAPGGGETAGSGGAAGPTEAAGASGAVEDAGRRGAGTLRPPYRAFTIGAVALSTLIAFENLAVTTAMPTAARALDGLALYGLAFGGPLAAGVVAMVLSGVWSDRRGAPRPLWTGIGLFSVGLLLAGAAPTMGVLVAGRVVQGFGAGLVGVALYVAVGHLYPAHLRPQVFTAFAAAWVLPSIVGPAIAGLIMEQAHWRWVFLGVPLIALPAGVLLRPALRGTTTRKRDAATGSARAAGAPKAGAPTAGAPTAGTGPTAGRDRDDAPDGAGADAPDATGRRLLWALVAAVGAGLLHYGGQGHGALAVPLLVAGLAGLVAAAPRLLPPGTPRARRGLPTVVILRGLAGAAMLGTEVFIPLMLSQERGMSAATAGAALTVSALGWSAGSWFQARPNRPLGTTGLLRLGFAFLLVGPIAVAVTVAPAVPVLVAIVGWAVAGLGMGMVYPTLSVLTLELSAPAEQGRNSSALQLADSLGTTMVLAVGGSLFAALVSRSADTAYLAIFLISGVLSLLGLLLAGRARAR
ncbi:MFS transporter [Allostreptomyces psammosilenae]|uniref:MFS family permease n=1 Tax=Allostreptomyces psammosilenae TaxID=1892865 RepID=A0A852ZST1_9ACTN|nr:MFS transporter [Allostreptomyces psammosilenae]NYI03874.1 MFS family permease [Allostreptomyces psammosilenae]